MQTKIYFLYEFLLLLIIIFDNLLILLLWTIIILIIIIIILLYIIISDKWSVSIPPEIVTKPKLSDIFKEHKKGTWDEFKSLKWV